MWRRMHKHHLHHHGGFASCESDTNTLAQCKPGQKVKVKNLTGHCHFRRRLETMGVLPGAEIDVVSAHASGPLVIRVKDSQFAIGRGMSRHIQVA